MVVGLIPGFLVIFPPNIILQKKLPYMLSSSLWDFPSAPFAARCQFKSHIMRPSWRPPTIMSNLTRVLRYVPLLEPEPNALVALTSWSQAERHSREGAAGTSARGKLLKGRAVHSRARASRRPVTPPPASSSGYLLIFNSFIWCCFAFEAQIPTMGAAAEKLFHMHCMRLRPPRKKHPAFQSKSIIPPAQVRRIKTLNIQEQQASTNL